MESAVAATVNLARIEVTLPSGDCWPESCEVSGGGILRGKIITLECGAPHIIHEGDTPDDTGGTKVPQYLPQDHVSTGSVKYWAVCRPLCRYHSGEPISANKNHPGK